MDSNVDSKHQSSSEVLHRGGDYYTMDGRGRLREANVRYTVRDSREDRKAGASNQNNGWNNNQVPEVDLSLFNRHFLYHERPVDLACRV